MNAGTSGMTLGDAELERYARHIVLREIGGAGQLRLKAGRVLVIGAGGIGSPVIQYLAAAGVGALLIVDDDHVALSNLQRQLLYRTADVGKGKAECAAAAVAALNPHVHVTALSERIGGARAAQLLEQVDVVVDGSDNFATRLAVADAALAARVPLVSAAVQQFEGQIGVFRGWEADLPCYRCLVGDDPAMAERSCSEQGVLGAMAGVVGSLAALEAIRVLAPFGTDPAGTLLRIDAMTMRFRTAVLRKDPGCPTCGG